MSPSPVPQTPPPALLFDLDGTLVDTVYQHVLAWHQALASAGIHLSVWRIHRRIGMSGGLLLSALLRETPLRLSEAEVEELKHRHADNYLRLVGRVQPLAGVPELLEHLTARGVPWAVATSGGRKTTEPALAALGLSIDDARVPIVTRDEVARAKPDPDLFVAAAKKLGAPIETSIVVGDSVWDLLAARRARALGVGLLTGGYGQDELERAGAYRVYDDPADMHRRLDELGIRAGKRLA